MTLFYSSILLLFVERSGAKGSAVVLGLLNCPSFPIESKGIEAQHSVAFVVSPGVDTLECAAIKIDGNPNLERESSRPFSPVEHNNNRKGNARPSHPEVGDSEEQLKE